MANYKVTDTELTSVANAIRTKGGTSSQLEFPGGFVNAINAISGGGGSLGEFSQCDYVDVQTADQTLLSVTNPLGVMPKQVRIKALTDPGDLTKIGAAMLDPYCGCAYLYEAPAGSGTYVFSPTETLTTSVHTYVMNANDLSVRRYGAAFTWDTSVTYRVYFYA